MDKQELLEKQAEKKDRENGQWRDDKLKAMEHDMRTFGGAVNKAFDRMEAVENRVREFERTMHSFEHETTRRNRFQDIKEALDLSLQYLNPMFTGIIEAQKLEWEHQRSMLELRLEHERDIHAQDRALMTTAVQGLQAVLEKALQK